MYDSERQIALAKYFAGGFDEVAAAEVFGEHLLGATTDHFAELTLRDRERIFNLGYFTWVEQQGVSLEAFEARRDPDYWARARASAGTWDDLIDAQRPYRRAGSGVGTGQPTRLRGVQATRASEPYPFGARTMGQGTSTTCCGAGSIRRARAFLETRRSRARSCGTAASSVPSRRPPARSVGHRLPSDRAAARPRDRRRGRPRVRRHAVRARLRAQRRSASPPRAVCG